MTIRQTNRYPLESTSKSFKQLRQPKRLRVLSIERFKLTMIGNNPLDNIYDPSLDAYNTLNCRPMTVASFAPIPANYGENVMGAVLAMDIRPLTNITGSGTYQSVVKIRKSNSYELEMTLNTGLIQLWFKGIGRIGNSNLTSGNILAGF